MPPLVSGVEWHWIPFRGEKYLQGLARVVQVGPIKTTLKALGTKCLKLNGDEPLPNFAFKFNLRRCILLVEPTDQTATATAADDPEVGRCRFTLSNPRLTAPVNKRLKLEYGEPLSSFAFKFYLGRYTEGEMLRAVKALNEVGRCRLTLSNPS